MIRGLLGFGIKVLKMNLNIEQLLIYKYDSEPYCKIKFFFWGKLYYYLSIYIYYSIKGTCRLENKLSAEVGREINTNKL